MANWLLGLTSGLVIPILIVICYLGVKIPSDNFPRLFSVIIVYRMMAMAILLVWFWGLNMYIWEKLRINYVFIFGFDSRQHVRWQHMLEVKLIIV